MTTSNQQSDTGSFFVSDSLSDRLSHWQADEAISETPTNAVENVSVDTLASDDNICHVTHESSAYVYPLLGWDEKEKRIDINVPYDQVKIFADSSDIKITFFKKKLAASYTSACFVENLWRVSIYFDDI